MIIVIGNAGLLFYFPPNDIAQAMGIEGVHHFHPVQPMVPTPKVEKVSQSQSYSDFRPPHYRSIKLPPRQQWPQHRG